MPLRPLSLLLLLAVLSGCTAEADQQAAAAPPAQPVDVAQVLFTPFSPSHTFTTRLESPQTVELRPRVSGVIESVEFTEGSLVSKGQLLFRIDPRPFAAEVKRLEAELGQAKASLRQAESEAARARSLQSSRAISTEQAESRVFLAQQRRSAVASVEAALTAARLNLEFSEVRSPIDGRISSAFITAGNNVEAGQSVLTNLVGVDRLYAYFDVDERTWNAEFSQLNASGDVPVSLQLPGSETMQHQGTVDFIDNRVDIRTGTLRVRAVFLADSQQLRPGAFARVKLTTGQARERVLVPDRAIGTDLKNRFVLIVNADNVLEYRQVEPGVRVGDLRVIESGLTPQDRIAVNGPARVGPGMPVQPRDVVIDTAQLSASQPQIAAAVPSA